MFCGGLAANRLFAEVRFSLGQDSDPPPPSTACLLHKPVRRCKRTPSCECRALIWRNLRGANDLRMKKKPAALFGVTAPVSAPKALGHIKIEVDNIGIGRY